MKIISSSGCSSLAKDKEPYILCRVWLSVADVRALWSRERRGWAEQSGLTFWSRATASSSCRYHCWNLASYCSRICMLVCTQTVYNAGAKWETPSNYDSETATVQATLLTSETINCSSLLSPLLVWTSSISTLVQLQICLINS